jgi:hypothetical protein
MEPQDPMAVMAKVDAWLCEADALVEAGHYEMGVVRAVSSLEVFLRRAFLEPYLRGNTLIQSGELGRVITDMVLSGQWSRRLDELFRAGWNIELGKMPQWKAARAAMDLRNKIVHEGAACQADQARKQIAACGEAMKQLLLKRVNVRPPVAGPKPGD